MTLEDLVTMYEECGYTVDSVWHCPFCVSEGTAFDLG